MGYNTVVLILNDHMHKLRESPRTLTYAITHPPNSEEEMSTWTTNIISVAAGFGEPSIVGYLKILPTYHADDKHILLAGWNQISRADAITDYDPETFKPKRTIKYPDWWDR